MYLVLGENWDIQSCCLYGSTLFTKSGKKNGPEFAGRFRAVIVRRA